MATNQTTGFFDIDTPEKFFALLKRKHRDLQSTTKDTADLMLMIMGLNHLREWIAPGYKPTQWNKTKNKNELKPKPLTPPEIFSWEIYQRPEFEILRSLCNHNKHIKPEVAQKLTTKHEATFDEISNVDAVSSIDNPTTDYLSDEQNVLEIIELVLNFYRTEWFERVPSAIG